MKPDAGLICGVLHNLARVISWRSRGPRWHVVTEAFGVGSNLAHELCERFGLDPDEEIGPTEEAAGEIINDKAASEAVGWEPVEQWEQQTQYRDRPSTGWYQCGGGYRPVTIDDAASADLVRALESERGMVAVTIQTPTGHALCVLCDPQFDRTATERTAGITFHTTKETDPPQAEILAKGSVYAYGPTRKIAIAKAAAALGPKEKK